MHTNSDRYCAQCHTMCEFRTIHAIYTSPREVCFNPSFVGVEVACGNETVRVCTNCAANETIHA